MESRRCPEREEELKRVGRREKVSHEKTKEELREIRGVGRKRTEGGASGDVHTTKVQVSRITSQHTVLQSMLSEYIDCNIKN